VHCYFTHLIDGTSRSSTKWQSCGPDVWVRGNWRSLGFRGRYGGDKSRSTSDLPPAHNVCFRPIPDIRNSTAQAVSQGLPGGRDMSARVTRAVF
jgi:hypothetical protein